MKKNFIGGKLSKGAQIGIIVACIFVIAAVILVVVLTSQSSTSTSTPTPTPTPTPTQTPSYDSTYNVCVSDDYRYKVTKDTSCDGNGWSTLDSFKGSSTQQDDMTKYLVQYSGSPNDRWALSPDGAGTGWEDQFTFYTNTNQGANDDIWCTALADNSGGGYKYQIQKGNDCGSSSGWTKQINFYGGKV